MLAMYFEAFQLQSHPHACGMQMVIESNGQ